MNPRLGFLLILLVFVAGTGAGYLALQARPSADVTGEKITDIRFGKVLQPNIRQDRIPGNTDAWAKVLFAGNKTTCDLPDPEFIDNNSDGFLDDITTPFPSYDYPGKFVYFSQKWYETWLGTIENPTRVHLGDLFEAAVAIKSERAGGVFY